MGRNLDGHGKHCVRIFTELAGEFDERLLTRGATSPRSTRDR